MSGTVLSWSPAIDWTGLSTIVLAAATVWLAWQTRATAKAAEASLDLAHHQLEGSLRPIVVPTRLSITGQGVDVDVRNIGPGPALKPFAWFERDIADPVEEEREWASGGYAPLGAGDSTVLGFRIAVLRQWRKRRPDCPLWLIVTYEDAAGGKWYSVSTTGIRPTSSLEELASEGWTDTKPKRGDYEASY